MADAAAGVHRGARGCGGVAAGGAGAAASGAGDQVLLKFLDFWL